MASIKDVAKHAGVAISTVSKVLNNYPNVSEDTKARVNAAVEELDFVPNAVASALSSKRVGRIALLIRLTDATLANNEICMQYLAGTLSRAKMLNMDVVTVFFSMLEGKSVDEVINYLRSQSISGIVVCVMDKSEETLLQLIERKVFPAVLVDAPIYNEKTTGLWVDQAKAQYEVAQKTLSEYEGVCQKLLYISGNDHGYVTTERMKGIERFARDYGMELTVADGDFSEKRAWEIAVRQGEAYDMIACGSDLMAIGAARALQELGIDRPVCGFDGIKLMGYAGKDMYTVKQDFFHVGEEAVEELRSLINGSQGRNLVLDYALTTIKYHDVIM